MANARHTNREKKEAKQSERECIDYISAWPPVDAESADQGDYHKSKRRKRQEEDRTKPIVETGEDEGHTKGESTFLWARPALAKWWRKRLQRSKQPEMSSLPQSHNPNTLLRYVASLPEGKVFLKKQLLALKSKTALHSECAAIHSAIASYHDMLNDVDSALDSLNTATNLDPLDKEIKWLHLKVKRQKEIDDKRQYLEEKILSCSPGERKMPRPVEVERRHYSTLDVKEFLFQYCVACTPVIITGLVENMTTVPWSMQHIKEVIGHKEASLKKTVKESTEWAKLEPACQMTVADFIDSLHLTSEPYYLFDWSIPTHAPELAKELIIPKLFAGEFLQRTAPGSLYKDSWPSLFIAPSALYSDLHVDAFGSNFWMALFQGRKRWIFFTEDDLPLLYPRYEDSLDLVFDVDLSTPDLEMHPLLCNTTPRQCILEQGELLFVPHGCPHRVENLEDSLAISANFVDLSNFHVVLEELRGSALLDPRAQDLFTQLSEESFPTEMFSQERDLPWEEFKSWPRHDCTVYDINLKEVEKVREQPASVNSTCR